MYFEKLGVGYDKEVSYTNRQLTVRAHGVGASRFDECSAGTGRD